MMRVEVLGCSGGMSNGFDTTCLLVGDTVLLDAGTGARKLSCEDGAAIKDILVSHSHLDHIVSICFLVDLDVEMRDQPTRIYSSAVTLDALRSHLLNSVLWPEIEKIEVNGVHMGQVHAVEPYKRFSAGGYDFTALPVEHTVPTVGYCLHGDEHDMVYMSDLRSMPDETWEWVKSNDRIKHFVCGCAFPDRMAEIARMSKHMTPEMVCELGEKLPASVELYATHLKPLYYEEITKQLEQTNRVRVLQDGMVFKI